MSKKAWPWLWLLVIAALGLNCGGDSSALPFSALEQNATVYETEGSGVTVLDSARFVSGQIAVNFDYSDTLYLKDYRVSGIPALEEAQKTGTYLGKSDGDEPVRYYYMPPMCGDFVLIDEYGNAGLYRTNEACD